MRYPYAARGLFRLFAVLLLLSLPACDTLNDLVGTEEEGGTGVVSAAILVGKVIAFHNPNPNTSIGEQSDWDYTFQHFLAIGCNPTRGYESTGWEVINNETIKVIFGEQFEQYTLKSSSGSLATGDLKGTFHLTSSVPGNVVDGTFEQISSPRYAGCN